MHKSTQRISPSTTPAPDFTESRILTLEAILAARDEADILRERARGEAVARADAAEAKVRRYGRMLDESTPGWRKEDELRVTGGTAAQWHAPLPSQPATVVTRETITLEHLRALRDEVLGEIERLIGLKHSILDAIGESPNSPLGAAGRDRCAAAINAKRTA
jgi:hypothetical protein